MPQFAPGVAKTAMAPIVAKPSGMSCEAELFLGPDDATKVVSSGLVPFVSTGAAKNVSLPITMPGAPGIYRGYIDVFAGGLRFLAYNLKEDVVIAAPVAPPFTMTVTSLTSTGDKYASAYWLVQVSVLIKNNNAVAVTHDLKCVATYGEYYRYNDPVSWWDRHWDDNNIWKTITLQPGQSVTLLSPYYYINGWHSGHQNYEWINWPDGQYKSGVPKEYWFRVVDNNGNASPAVSIGSALSW